MLRSPLIPLVIAAVACSTPSEDKDPVETDTVVIPDDTFVEDTAPPEDTDEEPANPEDSGSYFIIEVEGRAEVVRNAKFVGWQTFTAKWIKGLETPGKPRCIYEQKVLNWERDPEREGQTNPIAPADFDTCPGCVFSFTVTLENPPRIVDHYPWSEPLADTDVDTDTDADTDVDTDLPFIPPDVVGSKPGGRTLNCDKVQDQGFPEPDEFFDAGIPNWVGYAYDADADNDDDVNTGYLLVWFQRYGTWSPYAYSAHFDASSGAFDWKEAKPYQYAY